MEQPTHSFALAGGSVQPRVASRSWADVVTLSGARRFTAGFSGPDGALVGHVGADRGLARAPAGHGERPPRSPDPPSATAATPDRPPSRNARWALLCRSEPVRAGPPAAGATVAEGADVAPVPGPAVVADPLGDVADDPEPQAARGSNMASTASPAAARPPAVPTAAPPPDRRTSLDPGPCWAWRLHRLLGGTARGPSPRRPARPTRISVVFDPRDPLLSSPAAAKMGALYYCCPRAMAARPRDPPRSRCGFPRAIPRRPGQGDKPSCRIWLRPEHLLGATLMVCAGMLAVAVRARAAFAKNDCSIHPGGGAACRAARDQRRSYQGQKYRCRWASDSPRVRFGAHCGAVAAAAGSDSVMRGYCLM